MPRTNDPPSPAATTPAPDPLGDLAAGWQNAAQDWAAWWSKAVLPVATNVAEPASGAARLPPSVAPGTVAAITERYRAKFAELWKAAAAAVPGQPLAEILPPPPGDKRFSAAEWRELPYFAFLRQAYQIYADYLRELSAHADLPAADKRRLAFMTKQYVDAIAPTNFPATNPEVVKRAMASEGRSVIDGLANFLGDARRGRITMTDERAFEVGRNLAASPGSVVYRNELIEVLQYAPATPAVHSRPLLVVPPCINKYYILDLQPSNSFVRHAVLHGHTVFMISWRNIPAELGHLTWDDYLEKGVLQAMAVARDVTRSETVNALGFCVGGTLLSCALAVLAARGDASVASATFLTTMLDFADPGEIGVYLSEEFLSSREPAYISGERMRGRDLANAFASLRPNDLVWNYVVNNYMKGLTPPAFDLLFWNGDSANLPGPMYAYYLRNMYLENRLREPGALSMLGEPVDLGKVAVPTYVLASREDHIVPWRSAYRTTQLLGGDASFVLAASGHIAGVVNPPEPPRRNHWTNDALAGDADAWLERAAQVPGSWWPHWIAWLARHGGTQRKAPSREGNRRHPPLGPAPGQYVREPAG
jgi:polyhydroxyalkanoate synthase